MKDKRLRKLIKDLGHIDASKRRLAAEELAHADERAIYPLIKALRDDNPGVQDASLQSLISIGGDVTAYMVIPLLRDENPFIRNAAMIILKSLGQVSIPFLYSLLKDRDEDVRKFALDLLSEIRDGVSPERITPLLKDTNPNVRSAAAKALGMLGQRESIPYLLESLKDEEWVAFSAIEALGRIGDNAAVEALSGILSSGTESLRLASIDAIGQIGTEEAKVILRDHFKRASGIEREITIKGLLRLGILPEDNGLAPLILKLFEDGDWEERLLYLRGLTILRYHAAIPSIIDLAGSIDPSMPDSEEIIERFKVQLKEFGCSDSLIDVIRDPCFRFRGKTIAIEVIGELRCERAIPYLIELLNTDLRDVRRASIKAIGNIDGEGVKEVLIDSTDDYDSHVRKAAIIALGRIRAKEAFGPIMRLLEKEPYEDVREAAIKSLLSIDKDRFLSMRHRLEGILSDSIKRIIEDQPLED